MNQDLKAVTQDLEILKGKYGTWQAVADALEVTYRTICNIRSGTKRPSSSLRRLIQVYANQIKTFG